MVIHPEIIVVPDCPTVKFREPREKVDLDKELPKILHAQGWGSGTYFHIQFFTHDRNKLICEATYVVSEEAEGIHTSDNQYNPNTRTIYSRKAQIIGEWTVFFKEKEVKEEDSKSGESKISWNPGKKVHQLKLGDEVLYEDKDKAKVEEVKAA